MIPKNFNGFHMIFGQKRDEVTLKLYPNQVPGYVSQGNVPQPSTTLWATSYPDPQECAEFIHEAIMEKIYRERNAPYPGAMLPYGTIATYPVTAPAPVLFAWHVHHRTLVEPLTEPIEKRVAYIRATKPQTEIETRLRLLKPVKGSLPAELIEAWKEFWTVNQYVQQIERQLHNSPFRPPNVSDPISGNWNVDPYKVRLEQESAYREKRYFDALRMHAPEIEALHKVECPDCPWDGRTIFS
jgi:hypothetical protein